MDTTTRRKLGSTWRWHLGMPLAIAGALLLSLACTAGTPDAEKPAHVGAALQKDGDLLVTAPDTIVNRYAALQLDAAAGATQLTVKSGADLAPLTAGDLLMVVQLQGADLDAAEGPNYGTVTALHSAGRYELLTVREVSLDTITVATDCGGLRYDYSAAGRAQVIRVPQLGSLTVQETGSITAPPWDGQRGGVVAVHVDGPVQLDGPIDVSGKGFRGGRPNASYGLPAVDAAQFVSADPRDGAEKGEGVGGTPADYDLHGGRYGRGAAGNGGGGGNNHRSGGGGGANLTSGDQYTGAAGGGRGGYTQSLRSDDPLATGPGDDRWGGASRRERGGRGGHPLPQSVSDRLFLGGGGGGGDAGNGSAGEGGAGGGIIYLAAQTLGGSGALRADGAPGSDSTQSSDDGGGGGGGGGAVVLRVQESQDLPVSASGGSGGNHLLAATAAAGPGGGGGGGFIATVAQNGPNLNAGGGAAGTTRSLPMAVLASNGATAGATGLASGSALPGPGGGDPLCLPADVAVLLLSRPSLLVPGQPARYRFAIENHGQTPARRTTLQDVQPGWLTSAHWECQGSGGALCDNPIGSGAVLTRVDLPVGGRVELTVSLELPAEVTDILSYLIRATPSVVVQELVPADNVAEVWDPLAAQADLALAFNVPENVPAGQALKLALRPNNAGPSAARDVHVQLTLPAGTVLLTAGGEGWSCKLGVPVDCQRTELGPGEAADVQVVVQAAPIPLALTASISASTSDPDPENNQAGQTFRVVTPVSPVVASGCTLAPSEGLPPELGHSGLWFVFFGVVLWWRRMRLRARSGLAFARDPEHGSPVFD